MAAEVAAQKHAASKHLQDEDRNHDVSAALGAPVRRRTRGARRTRSRNLGFFVHISYRTGWVLVRHVYFPLKYFFTPSSATPRARDSEIFAILELMRLEKHSS